MLGHPSVRCLKCSCRVPALSLVLYPRQEYVSCPHPEGASCSPGSCEWNADGLFWPQTILAGGVFHEHSLPSGSASPPKRMNSLPSLLLILFQNDPVLPTSAQTIFLHSEHCPCSKLSSERVYPHSRHVSFLEGVIRDRHWPIYSLISFPLDCLKSICSWAPRLLIVYSDSLFCFFFKPDRNSSSIV